MFFVDSLYQLGGVYSLPAGVVAEFCPLTPIGAWGGGVIAGVMSPCTTRKVSSLPSGFVAEFCPLTQLERGVGGLLMAFSFLSYQQEGIFPTSRGCCWVLPLTLIMPIGPWGGVIAGGLFRYTIREGVFPTTTMTSRPVTIHITHETRHLVLHGLQDITYPKTTTAKAKYNFMSCVGFINMQISHPISSAPPTSKCSNFWVEFKFQVV